MTTLAVLVAPEEAAPLLRWAARFAKARSSTLTVLCWLSGLPDEGVRPATGGEGPRERALFEAARAALSEMGQPDTPLLQVRHTDPVEGVIHYVERHDVGLLVQATDGHQPEDSEVARLDDRILRFAPCDVLLVDPAGNEEATCDRIVVPMGLPLDGYASAEAGRIAGDTGVVVPLGIGQLLGRDAEAIARKELDLAVREASMDPLVQTAPQIEFAESPIHGAALTARTADLLVVGATNTKGLRQLRAIEAQEQANWQTAVALVRPARIKGDSRWERIRERTLGWLPRLRAMERVDLFDRLQAGARWNVDFLLMITLSAAIAAIGLLQSSPAVVIGAMVVAPLMTPLIGAGLALVQGNVRLFQNSLRAMGYGVVAALAVSTLIGAIVPQEDVTLEMLARGSPTVLDLAVAFLSGIAAAYALARPNLLGALAGVAIAAALVPPLATVGISLADGTFDLALGAGVLFLTNLVAIILGSSFVFWTLGVQASRSGLEKPAWGRRVFIGLILVAGLLMAPLWLSLRHSVREGQVRPLAFPLATDLLLEIDTYTQERPDIRLLMSGRSGRPGSFDVGVGVYIATDGPVPPSVRRDLEAIVRQHLGPDVPIQVEFLQRASERE